MLIASEWQVKRTGSGQDSDIANNKSRELNSEAGVRLTLADASAYFGPAPREKHRHTTLRFIEPDAGISQVEISEEKG